MAEAPNSHENAAQQDTVPQPEAQPHTTPTEERPHAYHPINWSAESSAVLDTPETLRPQQMIFPLCEACHPGGVSYRYTNIILQPLANIIDPLEQPHETISEASETTILIPVDSAPASNIYIHVPDLSIDIPNDYNMIHISSDAQRLMELEAVEALLILRASSEN